MRLILKYQHFKACASIPFLCVTVLVLSGFLPRIALADAFSQLLKRSAGVADDVPLNSTDDVLLRLRKLPTLRPSESALESARRASLQNPDDLRAAAVLIDGAKRIDQAVPDISLRSDLLRRNGNDMLQAAGLRVDAADDLVYLDSYLRRADFDLPSRYRAPTFSDFAAVAADDSRWTFWQKYIQPNKKLWAGGAALAVYLVAPEMWHDAAGNITEKGLALAGDLGGELFAAALRGIRKGGEEMGKRVANELPNLFGANFVTWLGMIALVGMLAVVILAPLRTRVGSFLKRYILGRTSRKTDLDSF
jgi:hypothetical protein